MPISLAAVVEGYGEVEAVPLLFRRICADHAVHLDVDVPRPVRVSRGTLLKEGELERAIELAELKAGSVPRGVVVLVDADDDCPAVLGPSLLNRARHTARGRFLVSVVLARTEYENWFLAAAASLAGKRGLRHELVPPADAEEIRDAKGWLTAHMADPADAYSQTVDQPALTALMDMAQARNADSFDKLWRDVTALVDALSSDA